MTSASDTTNQSPSAANGRISPIILDWSLALFMLGLVTLSGAVISVAWEGNNLWRFALIAFLGGLTAAVLARSRLLDGLATMLAVVIGVGSIWCLTAVFAGQLDGSWWERILGFYQPVADALVRDDLAGINRDLTAEFLLSLTVWLSSWIATWTLLRVGYVLLSLVPPVVLILANEHFAGQDRSWPIILMVMLCILVIARHHARSEGQRWKMQRISVGDSIVTRTILAGTAIALVVSSSLLLSPSAWSESVLQPLVATTINKFESVRLEAEYWFDDVLGTDLAPASMGRYTEFSDGFSVGGPLTLTDQPEVLAQVNSEAAPYLTARSYDYYTGRGWTSSSAGEFADADESVRQSPELLYNPNWEVALSPDARNQRVPNAATITMLAPSSNTVLSVNSFLTSNVQTVVRMGWTDVRDLPFPISPGILNTLPPDVQLLASLLLQSQLGGEPTASGPSAVSAEMQAAINVEVDDLVRRGIEVRWVATPDGIVETLYVTGRLPVFDDVEAVFRRQSGPSIQRTYTVRGLTSTANADQLSAAPGNYPAWVNEKYLQTGTSVTERTRQLTREIIGNETNPYQQAILIEQWLRTNIVYDENVNAPPANQDLVDYVLFDNRRGYCEHYAAAMTVMLRDLGIPARVVVGYAPGQYDPDTGSWLYLQSNAHAWVEVYFPGFGWIPFEPTASQPLGEFDIEPASTVDLEADAVATSEHLMPTADVSTPDVSENNSAATPQPTEADESIAPPTVLPPNSGSSVPGWFVPVATVATTTLAAGGLGWLLWHRGLRGLPPSVGLLKRVHRIGGWLGIRSAPSVTPREYARQFDDTAKPLAGPVKRITRAYEIDAFGPSPAREEMMDDARQAWRQIRGKAMFVLRHRRR